MTQNENTEVLYEQLQLPIFQNRMYDSEAEAVNCPKGDIRLVEDLGTGLVHNAAFRPELMAYDAHYQNEQGVSGVFKQHLEAVAGIVERCLGREELVEVGCGKGFFLEALLARDFDVTGFDPTYEGDNPRVRKHYFEPGLGIQARGLVLRHVLEHIQNPYAFLDHLREANGGHGRIYIEVPCFDWICEHRAWFDIFYEHVNYFRISDFARMFGSVIESGHLFGGQYLYVVVELGSIRPPVIDRADRPRFPADFSRGLTELKTAADGRSAIWGGASKGVIFALLAGRAGHTMKTVIDINPAKQDRYLPATGLLVQSPQKALAQLPAGAPIYVMNSNYLEEIKKMSNNAYTYIGVDHE